MPATFTTTINSARTASEGGLTQVVKQVEFTVTGSQDGQSFALPQSVSLGAAEATSFTPFAQLTESQVVAWVESAFENMDAVKAHIQIVLDRECAKAALTSETPPWAPPPAPEGVPAAPAQ